MTHSQHNENYIPKWTEQLNESKAKAFIMIGQDEEAKISICHLDNFNALEIAGSLKLIAADLEKSAEKDS